MKKLLSLLLVALLVIGAVALASCNLPTPDNGGDNTVEYDLEGAKDFLDVYFEDESTVTAADYKIPAQIVVGNYTYVVTWTTDRDDITITVANGQAFIDLNEKTTEEFTYTLTGTIADGDGNTITFTRTCTVPKYEVSSHADFLAAEKGATVTIEGVIVMINSISTGNKYNRITLVDANGNYGYYCHNLKADPIKDSNLEIGMTVAVTGVTDDYNGMRQLKDGTVKVINAEKTATPAVDVTEAFKAGTDLNNYIGNLVTIKGVTLGRQVLGGTNEYLYFELGGVEGYLRTYVTDFPHNLSHAASDNADKAAIDALHNANFGNTADVTGVLVRYNANFYIVPMDTTPFTNIITVELTDENKVDAELDSISLESSYSSDIVIDVATVGARYESVIIAWASNNPAVTYADGKLTITIPEDETTVEITVTATLGEVTKTKTFTVKLSKSITSVADVLAVANTKEHNTYTTEKYIISGIITSFANETYGNCYVQDETGASIYVYGLYINGAKYGDATDAKPVAGDYVVLTGVVGTYNGTAQMKNATLMSFSTITSVTDATAIGAAKEHNTYTEEKYAVTGVVESIANTTYGNLYIQDAEGNKLYIYGLYDQSGARFDKMANQPKVGDTITVLSVVGAYNNNAQLKNATIVCLVAAPEVDPDPTPDPDPEVPTPDTHTCTDTDSNFICDSTDCGKVVAPAADSTLTIAQANALAALYAHETYDGLYTTDKYYVTGVITSIVNTTYGNVYIADENGNEFYVYGLKDAEGSVRYDSMTVKPIVGDTITVYGTIGAYGKTTQMNTGFVTAHTAHTHNYSEANCTTAATCSICKATNGDALGHLDENGDNTCDRTGCGENLAAATATETVAIAGSTGTVSGKTITWTSTNFTLLNEQDKSTTAIRTTDTDHFRIYQSSKFTISANNGKKIVEVKITITESKYVTPMVNSLTAAGYTATADGNVVTITCAGGVDSIVFSASAQTRVKSFEITYK